MENKQSRWQSKDINIKGIWVDDSDSLAKAAGSSGILHCMVIVVDSVVHGRFLLRVWILVRVKCSLLYRKMIWHSSRATEIEALVQPRLAEPNPDTKESSTVRIDRDRT